MKPLSAHQKYEYVLKVMYSCKNSTQLAQCIGWLQGMEFADNDGIQGKWQDFTIRANLLEVYVDLHLSLEKFND